MRHDAGVGIAGQNGVTGTLDEPVMIFGTCEVTSTQLRTGRREGLEEAIPPEHAVLTGEGCWDEECDGEPGPLQHGPRVLGEVGVGVVEGEEHRPRREGPVLAEEVEQIFHPDDPVVSREEIDLERELLGRGAQRAGGGPRS